MILEAFIISVIIAYLRKGQLKKLADIPLKNWFLFIIPLILSVIVVLAGQIGDPASRLVYIRLVNIIQYVILLYAIYVNIHIKEMWIIGAGLFCNGLVVAVNNGMMPVSEVALKYAGMSYLLNPSEFDWNIRHVLMDSATRLSFLGDIIPRPGIGKIMPEVASIGDVLIAIGVFIIVQNYMLIKANRTD